MTSTFIRDPVLEHIEQCINEVVIRWPNTTLFIVLNMAGLIHSTWPINSICLHLTTKYKQVLQWPKLCNVVDDKTVLFIGPIK